MGPDLRKLWWAILGSNLFGWWGVVTGLTCMNPLLTCGFTTLCRVSQSITMHQVYALVLHVSCTREGQK